MNEEIIEARRKIQERIDVLKELKQPEITRRMLSDGIKSRAERMEIAGFRSKINSDLGEYGKKLNAIDEFLGSQDVVDFSGGVSTNCLRENPDTSIHNIPSLNKVRRTHRIGWF